MSSASRWILMTRAGCHLCDVMESRLEEVLTPRGQTWEAVDIDRDPALEERYGHVARFDESGGGEEFGLNMGLGILDDPDARGRARAAAERLNRDKIDTTDFLHRFLLQVGGEAVG